MTSRGSTQLPNAQVNKDAQVRKRGSLRQWGVHLIRVALFLAILSVMRLQHDRLVAISKSKLLSSIELSSVLEFFPSATQWGDPESRGGLQVLSSDRVTLGYVIQTAPDSDRFLGFSGPTNLLVAFDPTDRILAISILASEDTRDHVDLIQRSPKFFRFWKGMSWSEAAASKDIDGVAGATLTSLAMIQGIQQRLGAAEVSTKFPNPIELSDVTKFFPQASRVEQDDSVSSLWNVYDEESNACGAILKTSPAADAIIGYQGPTDSRVALALDGSIVGIAISASFDNEPYVGYVKGEASFERLLKQFSLSEWSELDLKEAGIEGVSGATMTSMAVAQGLVAAARNYETERAKSKKFYTTFNVVELGRSLSTIAIIAMGLVIGLTSLRGRRPVRVTFQILVILFLGFFNGDLLSMAMFAGWAKNGVPFANALGLVALAVASLALPIVARTNLYCSHLCPHGAVQQLLPRRWKQPSATHRWLGQTLLWIRPALIAWVILVSLLQLRFSLVDIEPFDAYAWRAAAWPTVLVAIVGIIASLWVPMAYCRYGCGTGAILQYVRRHSRSDRLTRADLFAVACLLLSLLIYLFGTT
jgi:Na+-translocating ferredoxin:NAD+ oxidoreductase RnfG subunit